MTMTATMTIRYSELIRLNNFEDRFEYLKLNGRVSETTFAGHRWLNQMLYSSSEWRRFRRRIMIRDDGCDLAHPDYSIYGGVYIHHLNPITIDDIVERRSCVFDPENAVCCSLKTHNAIHYGGLESSGVSKLVERYENDTCPWR